MKNETRVYGRWGGQPDGTPEDKSLCVESVCGNERGDIPHQCSRKRGNGPDGLYCRRHAEKFSNEIVATWYKTDQWHFTIIPVSVIKETADQLLIKTAQGNENTKKHATHERYWPSYGDALAHLRKRIKAARSNLTRDEAAFKRLESKTK